MCTGLVNNVGSHMVVQQIGWDGDSAVRVYKLNKLNKFDKFNKLKTLIILIHVQVYVGDWTDVVSCFVYSQGASYDPSGMNYRCPCCDKQTRTMQASFLLLHVRAGD